jgi:hypothetical protein
MDYTQQRIHRTLSRLIYQFTLPNPDLRETRRLIEVLMERYLELEDAPAERPLIDLLAGSLRQYYPDETSGQLEARARSALGRPNVREAAIREFNKRAQARDDGGPLPLTLVCPTLRYQSLG